MIPLAISAKNQLSSTEGKDFNMESARPAPNNRNNRRGGPNLMLHGTICSDDF